MIKFFVLTFIFLFLEIKSIEIYLENKTKQNLWKIDFNKESQRRVFKIIEDINIAGKNSIFAFGGSSSREFYRPNKIISQAINKPFYNCAVSNQSAFDSLKLIINVPDNSIIIYGIHPKSLESKEFDINQIIDGYYIGGKYFKYPISIDSNSIMKYISNNDKYILNISPIVNTYIYLLKDYLKNHKITLYDFLLNKYKVSYINNIPKQYYYFGKSIEYSKLMDKLKTWNKETILTYKNSMNLNFNLIDIMIQKAQEKNCKFVLLELPFSPIIENFYQEHKKRLKLYRKKIAELLQKHPNIIFLSNKSFNKVGQNLYYDTIHLLPSGRKYLEKNVNEILIKVISNDK